MEELMVIAKGKTLLKALKTDVFLEMFDKFL
jgi:hypothetical protein